MVVISIDGLPSYVFKDPRLPVPTLRRLIAEGATAPDGMQIVNPTVTWPNHTSMATGVPSTVHGVLFNGRLLRPGPRLPVKVEQRDRADLVRVPTVYDAAHAAGLSTSQVDWIPHQVGGTITWAFPERPSVDGALEKEMVAAGQITVEDLTAFKAAVITWRDEIWTRAASYIIKQHRPNVMYFHLLNLDGMHHRYGPRTLAGTSAIALADARIGEVMAAIDSAGMRDRATVFVVSDHGFKEVRRHIRPNAALRLVGLVEANGAQATACDLWVVPEGGTAMVYVTNPERREELVAKAKEVLGGLEGVDRVIEPTQYAEIELPRPDENDQAPDLVLAAKSGYAFDGSPEGEPLVVLPEGAYVGTHGYLSSDPEMNATLIAWGYGIRPGARAENVKNIDLAPTVAAVIGVPFPTAKGRVLKEILKWPKLTSPR